MPTTIEGRLSAFYFCLDSLHPAEIPIVKKSDAGAKILVSNSLLFDRYRRDIAVFPTRTHFIIIVATSVTPNERIKQIEFCVEVVGFGSG